MRVRAVLVAVFIGATVMAPAASAKPLPTYHSPGYKGTSKAPKTRPPATPKPLTLAAAGKFPHVIVDAAGTAHIVWTQDVPNGASILHYCRIKRGETACDNPPASQTFVPMNDYDPCCDGPQYNDDNNGPQVVAVGDQVVIMTHRFPTVFKKPDGSDQSNSTLIWVSEDGGTTFTGPGLVGDQEINGGRAVAFGPDNDPMIGVITDTVTGGTYFQAIRPGGYNSAKANLGPTDDQAYYGSLALQNGLPTAAFSDLSNETFVRQWTGAGDISDASTWTPAVPITGDEPQLAGGPSGLFLLNRPVYGGPYAVRKLGAGLAPGPAVNVSTKAAIGVFRTFAEDAGGGLLAAWESHTGAKQGVIMRTSSDGTTWSTARQIFDGDNIGQLGIDAAADGGGFAVGNLTGGVNSNGPIIATSFGNQAPTGKPGLGALAGGGDQSATSGCSSIGFGAVKISSPAGCFLHGTGASAKVSVSTDEVDLNGLRIIPDAGVTITVDPHAHTLNTTGAVRVLLTNGDITVTLFHGSLHVELPTGSAGTSLFSFDESQFGLDLFGFGATGKVDVILTPDGVRIPVSLTLPPIFGSIRGDATLLADRQTGLHVDSLHIHIGNVLIGPLTIDHIDISYTASSDTWAGDGAIEFPPPGEGGGLAIEKVIFVKGGYKSGEFVFKPPSPGIVIGPDVYLTEIGGGLFLDPTHINANATIGAGTPGVDGVSPVSVLGNFDMTFPSKGPADFKMSGAVSFFILQIATGYFDFQTDGYASFGGQMALDLGPVQVDGSTDGFIDASNGNFGADVKGNVYVQVPVAGTVGLGAEIAVSNAGFAACGKILGQSAGIEFPSSDLSPALLANPVLLGGSLIDHIAYPCDVGPYHVPPRPPASRATARAAADGGTAVQLPGGHPSETIVVKGAGQAPDVTVTGPGGVTVGPAGSAAGSMLSPIGGTTTYVALPKAAAGTWTVTPNAGSVPITGVLVGDGYTQATVKAALGGHGRARTIRYAVADGGNGQTVAFAEKGAFGTRVIGVAKNAKGTLHFAPAEAKGGRRTIVAEIRHDGLIKAAQTIATYVAPGPARPGRPAHVRATISRSTLNVRWGRSSGAAAFAVRIHGSHGRSELHLVKGKKHSLRITGLIPGETLTASVAGLTATGLTGTAAKVTAHGHAR